MEIIDNNRANRQQQTTNQIAPLTEIQARNIFIGVILVLTGGFWLLHNFRLFPSWLFDILFSWQMLLVVIGGYLLALKRFVGGAVITTIGAVMLLSDVIGIDISFSKVIFPLLFIASGAAIILSVKKK